MPVWYYGIRRYTSTSIYCTIELYFRGKKQARSTLGADLYNIDYPISRLGFFGILYKM